jgi:hypothetical protein
MGDLSEDPDSSARLTAPESGEGGSDHQDRPKLVALPGPTAEPAPAADDAEPSSADEALQPGNAVAPAATAGADADRLALERSLSGPRGSRIAGAPMPAATRASEALRSTDLIAHAPAVYASWGPQPLEVGDAIALTTTPELVPALRAELAMRAHAEAGLRIRAVDAETRLAARVLLSQRTAQTLRQVRAELDQLAGLLTDERARRQAAEQRVAELEQQLATDRGRSDDAADEIAALRDSLVALRAPAEGPDTATPGGGSPSAASPSAATPSAARPSGATEVRADRLSDALTRLRASTEPIDPAPAPTGQGASAALKPEMAGDAPASAAPTRLTAGVASAAPPATLAGPFRTLCRRDPALAGQLALSLLPLQRIAYPQPICYDLVLGLGHGCVQVTSDDGSTKIVRQATARPLEQVDFQLVGGPERFAKLLAAGRIRRRFGFWVLSRVRGNRDGLAALDALLGLPLDLPALVDSEISTDPLILAQLQAWIKRAQSE